MLAGANLNLAQVLPNMSAVAFLGVIVGLWATMRPSMVRDYDNRRLPPNPTARVMFVGLCLFTFLVFVIAIHSFKASAVGIVENVPVAGSLMVAFKDQAPLLAAVVLMGLLQLSMFRDLERSLLVWLHSAGHLHQDVQALSTHLLRCDFTPTDEENRLNREMARRFGVHVTGDIDGVGGVGVVTFQSWRKVATLLRIVRSWHPEQGGLLSESERTLLDEIETAHERKTQLAMTIVKLVEKADRGDPSAQSISDVLAALSRARYVSETDIEDLEARLRKILSGSGPQDKSLPLRLTGEEFKSYLHQIEGYFQVEYEILLQQIADLTARSVVLSGEVAPDRLEELRGLGFGGLGKIEPINFNRFLWFFLLVSVGGFLVMFVGTQGGSDGDAPPPEMLARFAFVMALAALVGAFAGSKRGLASAAQTPWSTYVLAALIGVAIHLSVNIMIDMVKHPSFLSALSQTAAPSDPTAAQATPEATPPATSAEQATPQAASQSTPGPLPVKRRLPWSALPFFLVLAICRLARLPAWPIGKRDDYLGSISERFLDGLSVSFALLIAFYLAIGAHAVLGMPLPPMLQASLDANGMFGVAFSWPLLTFGFLIGFFVVRDVRRAAHARIIDPSARHKQQEVLPPKARALPAPA